MEDLEDLICAYAMDGAGRGTRRDWDGVRAHRRDDGGTLWVHLQRGAAGTRRWLFEDSGLDAVICEALLSEESRPRCEAVGDGLLVSLRGVNLNPSAEPEDMVAVVAWVEPSRIVTVRRRKLMAIDAIRKALEAGTGPKSAAAFVAELAGGLVERMGPVIDDLEDRVDALEAEMVDGQAREIRQKLVGVRREAIALRRYIAPQREAMARLTTLTLEWLDASARGRLREVADRITRYVEDLDAARERAAIAQDELGNRLAEHMNRNIYVLSIVAAIFLPLGLITGLLGINVAGIPGEKWDWAFAAVIGLLVIVAGAELWLFRKLRWI